VARVRASARVVRVRDGARVVRVEIRVRVSVGVGVGVRVRIRVRVRVRVGSCASRRSQAARELSSASLLPLSSSRSAPG